ncbi:DUF1116 domain-containing protein [Marinobacter sp. LN3S78]|uniref:oxamate carbamoyltransferase subunit AllG family protein n=1 Tax=Marinobacter sp. LN3S78 TaxID=3382300 RepID=UPI00387ABA9F
MFEKLAAHFDEAKQLLLRGVIRLAPAQEYGVVTPLAQVVSPSMPVFIVGDDSYQAYAPIAESPPPALRFGSSDSICLQQFTEQTSLALEELAPALASSSVAMESIIAHALYHQQECHSLTEAANRALLSMISGIPDDTRQQLNANQGYVLPILMAASSWRLHQGPGDIEAVGGNGHEFGIRLRGSSRWLTCQADPPVGPRFSGKHNEPVLGAIGDSAVIDFCGLGGQSLDASPELVMLWKSQLPTNWRNRRDALVDASTGVVSARRIADTGLMPLVHLAMVGAGPEAGILGRGFYQPDPGLFTALKHQQTRG